MSNTTAISWCDHTWSPWEGCTKVSPACDNCYAAARNQRFARGANWGPGAPRRITVDWTKPRTWNTRAARDGTTPTVFPSICDPFDLEVPIAEFVRFLDLIRTTPNLRWLLLTKRIGNWRKRLETALGWIAADEVLRGVSDALSSWVKRWLGGDAPTNVVMMATVVTQEEADRDIPKLLAVPARRRGVSIEPMLGAINLRPWLWDCCGHFAPGTDHGLLGKEPDHCCGNPGPRCDLHWVIAGGESGPHARPMHPDWVRSLRDQCAAAGVPFHFKQHGGTAASGRLLDGVEHNGFPRCEHTGDMFGGEA